MQLEVSISPIVSNTSSGCPLFSLHVFPFCLPFYIPPIFWCMLFHLFFLSSSSLSDLLSSPGTSVVQRQFDSPLSGHSPCPLQSSRRLFHAWFMCLTECILAFSTFVFCCQLLLPVFRYSPCLLLNKMWSRIKHQWRLYAHTTTDPEKEKTNNYSWL